MNPKRDRASLSEINKCRTMVRQIVAHHFGTAKARTRYLPEGKTNFVFEVSLVGKGKFVIRLNSDPTKIQAFIKEQWATAQVRKLGVPTPEIVEVSNEMTEWPYMISRCVVGSEATTHPKRLQILHELGRYAALTTSVRTHGFGSTFDWSRNKLSRNATWQEFLKDELDLTHRLNFLERQRLISRSKKREIREILESSDYSKRRPSLNHGDLRLKNVLVDKQGKITALVDWEHCVSNFPAWDLSIALHDLSIDEKQHFLDGYRVSETRFKQTAPMMKALNIVNYAFKVEHLPKRERTAQLKHYRMRLNGLLDLFST